MSLFCQDLPSFSKTGGIRKQPITIFLKPSENKEYYQFRLLSFKNESNGRDYPFIKRWVHTHWGKTDQGKNIVDDTVVCLTTEYVPFDGPNTLKGRREACPMCRHDDENFGIWKSSGWQDKIAMKKHFAMQRQFQAIIPVYVVRDPFNDKNNGKLKCFIISNPDEYEAFDKLVHETWARIKHTNAGYEIFNGQHAVDFYLRMEKVPEIRYKGKPNETTVEVRKITKMAFGKGEKAYDIPEINEDAIRAFEFDQQYFTENTADEIQEFYRKHYSVVTQNVPDEDVDALFDEKPSTPPPTNAAMKELSKPSPDPTETDVDVDVENLLDEPEPEKPVKLATAGADLSPSEGIPEDEPEDAISESEVDSLLDDLDGLG